MAGPGGRSERRGAARAAERGAGGKFAARPQADVASLTTAKYSGNSALNPHWTAIISDPEPASAGLLVLADPGGTASPGGTAEDAEVVLVEHATATLAMEIARLQSLGESLAQARGSLALDLVNGEGEPPALSRAQALGYDLGRPHRVVAVEYRADAGAGL